MPLLLLLDFATAVFRTRSAGNATKFAVLFTFLLPFGIVLLFGAVKMILRVSNYKAIFLKYPWLLPDAWPKRVDQSPAEGFQGKALVEQKR